MFQKVLEDTLVLACQQPGKDLVSIKSLKYRIINQLMAEWDITFSEYNQILSTHTPVHPEIVYELQQCGSKQYDLESILVHDFVKNEKLLKILRNLNHSGFSKIASYLLAVDGLGTMKIGSCPNYDMKKYLKSLRYGLTGVAGLYDRDIDDEVRRMHVVAIRKVHEEMEQYSYSEDTDLSSRAVYQVMRAAFKEYANIELPEGNDTPIPDELLESGVQVYFKYIPVDKFQTFVEMMKKTHKMCSTEDVKCLLSDDEESVGKRKKEDVMSRSSEEDETPSKRKKEKS